MLKMFGFLLEGPTMMLGNNNSVVKSASFVERTLTKNTHTAQSPFIPFNKRWLLVGSRLVGSLQRQTLLIHLPSLS